MTKEEYKDAIEVSIIFHEGQRMFAVPKQPAQQEPVVQAWSEGYRAGVEDERTSEANIGIAGMGMKVEPARNNPYLTSPPAQRTWVGLTDEEIARVVSLAGFAPDWVEAHIAIQIVRVLEAKLKEKNT